MKAAWYERNGAARDVFTVGDMTEPVVGPGEVRVRLHASGVNPSDVKTRSGQSRKLAFGRAIPHSDGAGVIDQVGPGVSPARLGERVWTYNAAWQRPFGTAAQFVALPTTQAVQLPANADFAAGACLGIPVMTAHRALFADGSITGQTVLVSGGAGVVGHYAIQLAKWAGATVITTVSSTAKAAHARSAGADYTIYYKQEVVVERVMALTNGLGVDRIVEVEFGGNMAINQQVAKLDTVIATYGSTIRDPRLEFFPLVFKNLVIRMVHMYGMSEAAKLAAARGIAAWIGGGRAQFAIAARYPLQDIVAAHETVEAGAKVGHVLLEIA